MHPFPRHPSGALAVGKPLGLLNPKSGIPICETSAETPPGQFSLQDLVMLKFELPLQWHNGRSTDAKPSGHSLTYRKAAQRSPCEKSEAPVF